MEIREIHEDELGRWVEAMRAGLDEADTADGYLDWKRQSRETVWILASEDGQDVGAAIGIGGWHAPEGVARGEVRVAADARRRGVGSALLARLSEWATEVGYSDLMGPVKEVDDASLRWTERRGFAEVGRNSLLVLDLTSIASPEVVAPDGITIVSWAERPDAAAGMYEVAREAYPDIPGEEDAEIEPFEQWLSMDMQGAGDRPEATFVALADDEGSRTRSSRSPARDRRSPCTTSRASSAPGAAAASRARSRRPRSRGRWRTGTSGSRPRTRSGTSRSAGSTSVTATSSNRAPSPFEGLWARRRGRSRAIAVTSAPLFSETSHRSRTPSTRSSGYALRTGSAAVPRYPSSAGP
jgi:GNAT superfamily N-acetyltransferase